MVEFKSKFNSQMVEEANNNLIKKSMKFYIFLSLIFILLGIYFILGQDDDLVTGIVLCVIGVIFTPLMVLFIKLYQKKMNKSLSILSDETEQVFKFTEDKVYIIQTQGEKYRSATEANYDYFYKISETETQYILFISTNQVYVIQKDSLSSGTFEELNTYFETHLKDKFTRK